MLEARSVCAIDCETRQLSGGYTDPGPGDGATDYLNGGVGYDYASEVDSLLDVLVSIE